MHFLVLEFEIKFHWNVILGVLLTMSQHWFRCWLGAKQATSHHLNPCWPSSTTPCGISGPLWVDPLWPSDTIWQHSSGSTWAQVKAFACWHQAINWSNVDSSSVRSSDINLRAISQEIPQPSITQISLKINGLRFYSYLPRDNELMQQTHRWIMGFSYEDLGRKLTVL